MTKMCHHATIIVKTPRPARTAKRENEAARRARPGRLWMAAVAMASVWLAAGLSASAQNAPNNSPVSATVRPGEATKRDEILSRLNPETAAALQGKTQSKPMPTPEPPLYEQFSPDQVVVAEVNKGEYMLTRQELDGMTTARFGEIKEGLHPSVLADLQRKREEMMTQIMQEWVVVKGITVLAYKAGLTVTPEETQTRLDEIGKETGTADLRQALTKEAVLVGIDSEEMQRDIKEALLVDKFILREVDKKFPEAELRKIYQQTPFRYTAPLRVHAWQIFRRTDSQVMSKVEIKDIRAQMYELSKSLAKPKDKIKAFQEAAAKFSEDPFTKDRGGDMGWIDPSASLSKEIFDTIFIKLKPGEVSKLIETPLGFHVIFVSERKESQGLTFDAFARKAVVDDLVVRYKTEVGPGLLADHPELNVCSNVSGYRLVGGQQLEPQAKRTFPPDRIKMADTPPVPSPAPLSAPKIAPRPTPRPLLTPRPLPRSGTAVRTPGR